jgi:hypothetical protein
MLASVGARLVARRPARLRAQLRASGVCTPVLTGQRAWLARLRARQLTRVSAQEHSRAFGPALGVHSAAEAMLTHAPASVAALEMPEAACACGGVCGTLAAREPPVCCGMPVRPLDQNGLMAGTALATVSALLVALVSAGQDAPTGLRADFAHGHHVATDHHSMATLGHRLEHFEGTPPRARPLLLGLAALVAALARAPVAARHQLAAHTTTLEDGVGVVVRVTRGNACVAAGKKAFAGQVAASVRAPVEVVRRACTHVVDWVVAAGQTQRIAIRIS